MLSEQIEMYAFEIFVKDFIHLLVGDVNVNVSYKGESLITCLNTCSNSHHTMQFSKPTPYRL